jgi:serine/threonine protein phosphatase PrpC
VPGFSFSTAMVPASGAGEDRVSVFWLAGGVVVALADGAGGTGGGALAAQAVIDEAAQAGVDADWPSLLLRLDARPHDLGHGQTTAVVLSITPRGIRGASIGDSGAWLIGRDGVVELTAQQKPRPLLGSGAAFPVPFSAPPLGDAVLVVASDGLFDHASREAIVRAAAATDASTLVELVRLPGGALQDDVAVVTVRSSTPVVADDTRRPTA